MARSRAKRPVLQAIVLAERVYVDQATSKCVIAGTFNTIWSRKVPGIFSQFSFVYICVTDTNRPLPCELRWVDLTTNEVLMTAEQISIGGTDPLMGWETAIQIPPLPVKSFGVHALELYCEGELLGSKRVQVKEPKDAK